ncbi:hypothetical protein FRX31_007677 [Thalictrum thalictroides]|uniref:Uncharacterized protein n=1 Tax=Thalictrum thalictroides TaxID=46969 RepID=A0A7J6WZ44_THATH|nr:hypothetical protein FRX31_007677 [Thalictrum thalictroides]
MSTTYVDHVRLSFGLRIFQNVDHDVVSDIDNSSELPNEDIDNAFELPNEPATGTGIMDSLSCLRI